MPATTKNREAGYTLAELLIVVSLIGLVAMIAVPTAGRLIRHTNSLGAYSTVQQVLAGARLQAVKRGANVVVEISLTPTKQIRLRTFQDRANDKTSPLPADEQAAAGNFVQDIGNVRHLAGDRRADARRLHRPAGNPSLEERRHQGRPRFGRRVRRIPGRRERHRPDRVPPGRRNPSAGGEQLGSSDRHGRTGNLLRGSGRHELLPGDCRQQLLREVPGGQAGPGHRIRVERVDMELEIRRPGPRWPFPTPRPRRPDASARRTRESGLTIVEVPIALALLAFGLLAMAPMFTGAVRTNASAFNLTNANTLAREKMEELIGYPSTDPRLGVPANGEHGRPRGHDDDRDRLDRRDEHLLRQRPSPLVQALDRRGVHGGDVARNRLVSLSVYPDLHRGAVPRGPDDPRRGARNLWSEAPDGHRSADERPVPRAAADRPSLST